MDLSDGVISGHVIGANVQGEDFDIARITDGVAYQDNDVNLDASELAVPMPSVPTFQPPE